MTPATRQLRLRTSLLVRLSLYLPQMSQVQITLLASEDNHTLRGALRFQRQLCASPLLNHLDPL